MLQAARRAAGSKPVVGSSRKTRSGIADEGHAEVEPPLLPSRERLQAGVALLAEADEVDDLVDVARVGVVPGEELVRLADVRSGLELGLLQDDADALRSRVRAARVVARAPSTSPPSRWR